LTFKAAAIPGRNNFRSKIFSRDYGKGNFTMLVLFFALSSILGQLVQVLKKAIDCLHAADIFVLEFNMLEKSTNTQFRSEHKLIGLKKQTLRISDLICCRQANGNNCSNSKGRC
jgi:hypothetical protein